MGVTATESDQGREKNSTGGVPVSARLLDASGVLSIGLLCLLAGVLLYYWLPIALVEKAASKRRAHLLLETDYGVLLEACRELIARVDKGDLEPRKYFLRPSPDSEVASFPRAILDLEPITVSVFSEQGPVQVVVGGGFHVSGVTALSSGVSQEHKAGDIQLIPGLWYFDGDYDEYPKARRRIQRMVQQERRKE